MKLEGKKAFAARVLGVGAGRVLFNKARLAEIKEAMTRQDIIELLKDNAIAIKEIKGRAKKEKRTTRKKAGSRRHVPRNPKSVYITITRKLRGHLSELRKQNKLSKENFLQLRKEIKARAFKDKVHLKERIANLK